MKKEEIGIWTERADAHWHEGRIEGWCRNSHVLGTDDVLLIADVRGLRLGSWCIKKCLLDPESIEREFKHAESELRASFDVMTAMQKVRVEYKKVTGKEMPSEGGRA